MGRTIAAATLFVGCLFAAAGCGPATFVSAEPPPETHAEAWFASSLAKVEGALNRAMFENGLSVDSSTSTGEVVATKQQLPFVDEESGQPASGPLPLYRLRARITRPGQTHVKVVLTAECRACDGETPYEWEYPGDVIRAVLDDTRKILREKRARVAYPPRCRPVRWHRPPGR
jgi:hypothetical protein